MQRGSGAYNVRALVGFTHLAAISSVLAVNSAFNSIGMLPFRKTTGGDSRNVRISASAAALALYRSALRCSPCRFDALWFNNPQRTAAVD